MVVIIDWHLLPEPTDLRNVALIFSYIWKTHNLPGQSQHAEYNKILVFERWIQVFALNHLSTYPGGREIV